MRIVTDDQEQDGFFWVERLLPKHHGLPNHDLIKGFSGQWNLIGVAQTPLHVGSGELSLMEGQMVFSFNRQVNGDSEICIISGSSWKGAFRSMVELFSPSCFTGDSCPSQCPACSLFGTMGYRGRIAVEDSPIANDVQTEIATFRQRTEPRRNAPRGEDAIFHKLYNRDMTPQQLVHPEDWERVEVIPAQTRFLVRIQFQNLQSWEMGLLLFSLGLTKSYTFDFKAGGAKNRGMGVLRLHWHKGYAASGINWLLDGSKGSPSLSLADRASYVSDYFGKAEEWGCLADVQNLAEILKREYRKDAANA